VIVVTELHVLVVEDNPGDARLVVEMLRHDQPAGFRLTHVSTVTEAVDRLVRTPHDVDAVVLDLSLPDESGLDTVRRVTSVAGRAVVVVMTGAGDDDLGRAAMQIGAQDYLVKGHVDAQELRRALLFARERQEVRLHLEHESLTDPLTGLLNRRGFLADAGRQCLAASRNGTPFLLVFMDLDRLKFVNDTFGHAEGDRALTEAARAIRSSFHDDDLLARIGGDEFAALAMGLPASAAPAIRRRLEQVLGAVNDRPGRAYPLTVSVGILPCPANERRSIDSLLDHADRLMYDAKRGRQTAVETG
jgi:diguanylate cyclase (GGDEF)-like protein